jgi:cell shape-determining protein MreC
MKNTLRIFVVSLIMLASSLSVSANTNGLTPDKADKAPTAQQQQRLLEIETRVNQIKAIDKSQLTKAERKELRSELKELKKEARKGGGIYLSTGAVIIVVLLLVILL